MSKTFKDNKYSQKSSVTKKRRLTKAEKFKKQKEDFDANAKRLLKGQLIFC